MSTDPSSLSLEPRRSAPVPIVALDFPSSRAALDMLDRLPEADFFKVGLQLFAAEGPEIVQVLKDRGHRVFLDLKFHDIPNTVSGAVGSAARLGVDLLTVHAFGGEAMLRAAVAAAAEASVRPRILAVTVLTSLGPADLSTLLGHEVADTAEEVVRLATLGERAGVDGVVASLHEVPSVRGATRSDFLVLTPGIRLPGDASGDQARVGTPRDAAELGADFFILGRSVTAAADPATAYRRAVDDLELLSAATA